jgi:threonine aldolase
MKIDHEHARSIAASLAKTGFVKHIAPVDTNIATVESEADYPAENFLAEMKNTNIHLVGMGPQFIRMVTHLGIDKLKMDYLLSHLSAL